MLSHREYIYNNVNKMNTENTLNKTHNIQRILLTKILLLHFSYVFVKYVDVLDNASLPTPESSTENDDDDD